MPEKEDMEKEALEQELSTLVEMTLRLEDEVNSFPRDNEE